MWAHSVDYRDRDRKKQHLLHRGFWLHNLPRLMLACRLAGHRPVVDGFDSRTRADSARWVACDRCGVRGEPQGSLQPDIWRIGQRYTGPWRREDLPADPEERFTALKSLKGAHYPPGPLEAKPTGTLGGEVVVGGGVKSLGFTLKVGNAGSTHTLALSVHLWWASLYLHTERFGTWLQRRLNPTGYESKVIEVDVHSGHLWWKLWANRNGRSSSDPRWRSGWAQIDPRTLLLGEKRYAYTAYGASVTGMVRMPHGDQHQVLLQLQRRAYGRKRGRKQLGWTVEWECPTGIPAAPRGGGLYGGGVDVTAAAAANGQWVTQATALIASKLTDLRTRHEWHPAPAA